ncbi:Crp/Fnr family transcriptional regulator [Mucilaginibacter robiniae]|uniref:Crp/Fnr family transcriptional regulator n=1 Tax=Mucilaginibacter robiniae TaxID=2728022 RepID=A0A7L5DZ06_9SPHI|nr:Crp/Fnr family transcriptional regulator [Mucilaginibacter robiniae]QJD96225.1 Crp/Fnr family transcriptional regulator [Mucilaginibacter robiniae]
MQDIFKAYLKRHTDFNQDELAMIESATRLKKLRRHQYLLQEGEIAHHHCFVTKGILRAYSVDEKGNEYILRFANENGWISDCESLYRGTPSKLNIDAIEDSEVLLFENAGKDMLIEKLPAFAKMVNIMKNESSVTFQNRVHESITSTSRQKYESFVKRYPDLALRVPQAMIASYLGIQPETLSRLRHAR